jgi:hypothetical protein
MQNLQNVWYDGFELFVTVFVAALVWTTVLAGLYQLIRDWIRQVHVATQEFAQQRYVQRPETGPQVAHPQPTTGH